MVNTQEAFEFPGMKILQFAFDSKEENDYLPHTYEKNCVVYLEVLTTTTLHTAGMKNARLTTRISPESTSRPTDGMLLGFYPCLAWASVADIAIAPLQDVLCLGSEARMNTPATSGQNWKWRFTWDMIPNTRSTVWRCLPRSI